MPEEIKALIAFIDFYNSAHNKNIALFMTSSDGTVVDMEADPACWDRASPSEWTYSVHER